MISSSGGERQTTTAGQTSKHDESTTDGKRFLEDQEEVRRLGDPNKARRRRAHEGKQRTEWEQEQQHHELHGFPMDGRGSSRTKLSARQISFSSGVG